MRGMGAAATDRDSRRPELRQRQGLEGTERGQTLSRWQTAVGGWEEAG